VKRRNEEKKNSCAQFRIAAKSYRVASSALQDAKCKPCD